MPVSLELDGVSQDWLFDFSFPWGVDIAMGASWAFSIGDSSVVFLCGGMHMVEFQYYQPWSIGWDEVSARLGPDYFWFMQWNVGPFLGLEAYIALDKSWYLLLGCIAAYDILEVLPVISPDSYSLAGAWSIVPIIALARGK